MIQTALNLKRLLGNELVSLDRLAELVQGHTVTARLRCWELANAGFPVLYQDARDQYSVKNTVKNVLSAGDITLLWLVRLVDAADSFSSAYG